MQCVDVTTVFSYPWLVLVSRAVNNIALSGELNDTLRYLGLSVYLFVFQILKLFLSL